MLGLWSTHSPANLVPGKPDAGQGSRSTRDHSPHPSVSTQLGEHSFYRCYYYYYLCYLYYYCNKLIILLLLIIILLLLLIIATTQRPWNKQRCDQIKAATQRHVCNMLLRKQIPTTLSLESSTRSAGGIFPVTIALLQSESLIDSSGEAKPSLHRYKLWRMVSSAARALSRIRFAWYQVCQRMRRPQPQHTYIHIHICICV